MFWFVFSFSHCLTHDTHEIKVEKNPSQIKIQFITNPKAKLKVILDYFIYGVHTYINIL